MSVPESIVQAQTDALLRRVAREQEARCRRARESAEEQARAIVAHAWDEARARLRQAVEEERRAIEQALADRRAAHDTASRRRSQSSLRTIMDGAWQELPGVLASAWQRADARLRWCRAACSTAQACLDPQRGCALELDAGAARDGEDAARGLLEGWCGTAVEVRRVPGLGPGLRIRCGRACVDATIPGLLASRERIESELLAEIERLGAAPEDPA